MAQRFDSRDLRINNKYMSTAKPAGLKGVSYLVDSKGRKKALVVDFASHKRAVEEFLEDLYGHQKIKQRKGEPCLTKAEFLNNFSNLDSRVRGNDPVGTRDLRKQASRLIKQEMLANCSQAIRTI
jgi:hypothetical protein